MGMGNGMLDGKLLTFNWNAVNGQHTNWG